METVINIVLAIVWSILFGMLGNYILLALVPDKYKDKLFKIFPFLPKLKYAIPMYLMAGVCYFFALGYFETKELLIRLIILMGCVLVSAQIVRLIALILNDNIEETYEEEMERKKNM